MESGQDLRSINDGHKAMPQQLQLIANPYNPGANPSGNQQDKEGEEGGKITTIGELHYE